MVKLNVLMSVLYHEHGSELAFHEVVLIFQLLQTSQAPVLHLLAIHPIILKNQSRLQC